MGGIESSNKTMFQGKVLAWIKACRFRLSSGVFRRQVGDIEFPRILEVLTVSYLETYSEIQKTPKTAQFISRKRCPHILKGVSSKNYWANK